MLEGKTILVIGGTGSLGNILTEYLYKQNKIIVFSRDENKQWAMKMKYPTVNFVIGDIRNTESVEQCLRNYKPNIILIVSALKHIDICEYNINECINTNILGTKNVIDISIKLNDPNLDTICFISTDKACSPINIYGQCKAVSEKIVISSSLNNTHIKFVCVRYGNVLNSRGSIIPKFNEIGTDSAHTFFPVTVDTMTRFLMTLDQSFKLIMMAIIHGNSGDIWIPFIDSFKIVDIANYFSKKYNKPIKITGIRPGEKIHECLINQYEAPRTEYKLIDAEKYYVIKPCYKDYNLKNITEEYSSENTSDLTLLVPKIEKILQDCIF